MYAFNVKTSWFFTIVCITLLFLPKINIISFSGRETAGIRTDDLVLLFFSILLFWGHLSTKQTFSNIEKTLFTIVIFSLFSYASNQLLIKFDRLHVEANILYALRIFEYFLFFYVGYYAMRILNLNKLIFFYFALNTALMTFQKCGWIGYWGLYGYESTCVYRCAGIASFPSEMGMLLNLVFCYLLFKREEVLAPLKKFFFRYTFIFLMVETVYPFLLFLLTGALLMINGSRISFLAHIFIFFLYLVTKTKYRILFFSSTLFFSIILGVSFGQSTSIKNSTLVERSEAIFSMKNIDLIEKVWLSIDTTEDPIGKESVKHNSTEEDTSWWMRIHKWLYALKIFVNHPETYFQGIGPGFAMAALDGGTLRIFVEYGIIGTILFFVLFYQIANISEPLKYCMIAFMINMIFIDVYLAYKPMALLFFMTGYAHAEKIKAQVNNPQYLLTTI